MLGRHAGQLPAWNRNAPAAGDWLCEGSAAVSDARSACMPLRAGLFLAPQMVGEALKGGRLVAGVMAREGYAAFPGAASGAAAAPAAEVAAAAAPAQRNGAPGESLAHVCACQGLHASRDTSHHSCALLPCPPEAVSVRRRRGGRASLLHHRGAAGLGPAHVRILPRGAGRLPGRRLHRTHARCVGAPALHLPSCSSCAGQHDECLNY